MCVRDSADILESLVKKQMRLHIRRRPQRTLNNLAVQIDDDKILGLHGFVWNAARLDHDQTILPRYSAGIAERIKNEATPNQLEIGFQDFFAEFDQFHAAPLAAAAM
jgi:hypothetical protein